MSRYTIIREGVWGLGGFGERLIERERAVGGKMREKGEAGV